MLYRSCQQNLLNICFRAFSRRFCWYKANQKSCWRRVETTFMVTHYIKSWANFWTLGVASLESESHQRWGIYSSLRLFPSWWAKLILKACRAAKVNHLTISKQKHLAWLINLTQAGLKFNDVQCSEPRDYSLSICIQSL